MRLRAALALLLAMGVTVTARVVDPPPKAWLPHNASEAKQRLDEAAAILGDELAGWKLALSGGASFAFPPEPNDTAPYCAGSNCARLSDLMPQLEFKVKHSVVLCPLADFYAGKCLAPGCGVCDPACPIFRRFPEYLTLPGPLGTGLFCNGCNPCCQKADDPTLALNNTCRIVE